mmetsp:Transcript_28447/g.48412  ORF Transcript_28447/g.48412 Transcript_28447/m.48412 type:complete len:117 (-) Transcript_28447:753-1103(-)
MTTYHSMNIAIFWPSATGMFVHHGLVIILVQALIWNKSTAFVVVFSQTVEKVISTVSANFLATSMQSAGSLDFRPFLNPMKGASVSTIIRSRGIDGSISLNGAPRSFLQIVPVKPM